MNELDKALFRPLPETDWRKLVEAEREEYYQQGILDGKDGMDDAFGDVYESGKITMKYIILNLLPEAHSRHDRLYRDELIGIIESINITSCDESIKEAEQRGRDMEKERVAIDIEKLVSLIPDTGSHSAMAKDTATTCARIAREGYPEALEAARNKPSLKEDNK